MVSHFQNSADFKQVHPLLLNSCEGSGLKFYIFHVYVSKGQLKLNLSRKIFQTIGASSVTTLSQFEQVEDLYTESNLEQTHPAITLSV